MAHKSDLPNHISGLEISQSTVELCAAQVVPAPVSPGMLDPGETPFFHELSPALNNIIIPALPELTRIWRVGSRLALIAEDGCFLGWL
jgi:hypothetical protein